MVKVKVCGITNLEDAMAAVECGADALGFVFAPSPRQVTLEIVRDIVMQLPPFVYKVGVFVDSDLHTVRSTSLTCGLDLVQLHGSENQAYCAALFPRAIKAFVASPSALERLKSFRVAAYMLDRDKAVSNVAEIDHWELARQAGNRGRVVLAGGLTPDNVARAIEIARPYAVDVASGVEQSPGKKDHAKLRAFIQAARQAAQY